MADNLDPNIIRELNDGMTRFQDAVSSMVPSFILMNSVMQDMIASHKGTKGNMKDATNAVNEYIKSQKEASLAAKIAAKMDEEKVRREKKKEEATDKVWDALGTFGKTVLSGTNVIGGMASAVGSLAGAAGSAASLFIKIAPYAGLFGKALTYSLEQLYKYNDIVIESQNKLAKMNAIIPSEELQSLAFQAGYAGDMVKVLVDKVVDADDGFTALGGTNRENIKLMLEMMAIEKERRQEYMKMGYTLNDVNDAQIGYIKLLSTSGFYLRAENIDKKKLTEQSLRYLDILRELADIEGTDLETQKKKSQAALDQASFVSQINALLFQASELRAKGDIESKKAAEAMEAEAERRVEIATTARKYLTGDDLTGVYRFLSNGIVDTANLFLAYRPELADALSKSNAGLMSMNELNQAFMQSMRTTQQLNAQFAEYYSLANQEFINQLGITKDANIKSARNLLLLGDSASATERILGKLGALDTDKLRTQAVEAQEALINNKKLSQSLLELAQGPFTTALNTLINAFNRLSEFIFERFPRKDAGTPAGASGNSGKTPSVELPIGNLPIPDYGKGITDFKTAGRGTSPIVGGFGFPRKATRNEILAMIREIESNPSDPYNSMYPGKTFPDLKKMSLQQVMDIQNKIKGQPAIGAYQFKPDTLAEAMVAAKLKPSDTFNEEVQDMLANVLLDRRGYKEWASNQKGVTTESFAKELSKEWAAFPAGPDNKSYYPENNKAGMEYDVMIKRLRGMRDGGITGGPETGFPVMIHPNELVQPLNPNSFLEKLATTSADQIEKLLDTTQQNSGGDILTQIADMQSSFYSEMSSKFDSMIAKLAESNDIQDKILKYSQV